MFMDKKVEFDTSKGGVLNRSMNEEAVDILIVGAGMVGAALALSLQSLPYRIALVDSQAEGTFRQTTSTPQSVSEFEPRVSALTLASQSLLAELGVWSSLLPTQISPYREMHVWDELGTEHIHFDAADMQRSELGFIVENRHLIASMHTQLLQQENLDCFFGANIDSISRAPHRSSHRTSTTDGSPESVISLKGGQILRAKLLVAADGANSLVRSRFSFPMREWDYGHQAIVTTVKTEQMHGNIARQRFSESGPVAFLPLNDTENSGRYSSIVWSLETERAKQVMSLDKTEFMAQLTLAIEGRLGEIEDVATRHSFPLRQRHAKTYVDNGVVLIGDAAHTIHPLAGQGVNLGFKDVSALKKVLQQAYDDRLSVSNDLLLRRYQRARQSDNVIMMGVMEGFKRMFEQQDPLVRLVRNLGMAWVNKQRFIKHEIAKQAMGL